MKAKTCALAVAVLIAWALKQHYAAARADDLWWILAPTTTLAGAASGVPFVWQPGEGFLSHERLFLVEQSCAGVNFMIAAFGMLVLTLLHRVGGGMSAAQVLTVSLAASYVAAVTTNGVRIAIALSIARPAVLNAFSPAAVHRIEGIAVYFGGLALLYAIAHHLDRRARSDGRVSGTVSGHVARAFRRAALPLTAYYAVTLAIPLLNGAARAGDAFIEHALVVLIVPPVVIVCACVVRVAVNRACNWYPARRFRASSL